MGKYQENWKHKKCEKCEIRSMENSKVVKDNNRNKRESIVGRGGEGNFKNLHGYTMQLILLYYY